MRQWPRCRKQIAEATDPCSGASFREAIRRRSLIAACQINALDRGELVGLAAALGRARARREIDHDGGRAGESRDVVAGAAVEHVAAVTTVQCVGAAQAQEQIVAGEASEVVGGVAAGDDVIADGWARGCYEPVTS